MLSLRPWKFSELLPLLAPLGAKRGTGAGGDPLLSGACADSRQVGQGGLFCAIRGAVADGKDFIPHALAAGAAAILTDSPDVSAPVPVLLVPPEMGYAALGRVAEAFADFPARRLRLAGVTGTAGKTTTVFLLREILRAAGVPTGMVGTVVYDLGRGEEIPADRTTPTPFLLQELFARMVANGVTTVVMECSSAALTQERTGTARFAAAAFTNFSRDHLDFHGTMEAYWEAKAKLFRTMLLPGATAVLNGDDPAVERMARELENRPEISCRRVLFSRKNTPSPWPCPLPGAFNQDNALCAGLLARALGVDEGTIARTLAHTAGAPGRLQRFACPNGAQAFVDYAHTPEEIRCALQALRPECPGRLGVLFGCGGDRDRGKRPLMAQAAAENADFLWLTSDNPRTEEPAAILEEVRAGVPSGVPYRMEVDRRKAIGAAVAACAPGDWLLIAGKGHEDYQEIQHVKHPFSDWAVLQELFPPSP
ncbi:MAG: UDP-N-acetylmuramoyl-L-alanyl-D-glutamate--2,6-diaminopimelate ligase [Oligosphaeraceae bacterium]